MEINRDDLFSKTDILLFSILEELKQLNKSLHPMRKDTGVKAKAKSKSKPRAKDQKGEKVNGVDLNIGGGLIVSNDSNG